MLLVLLNRGVRSHGSFKRSETAVTDPGLSKIIFAFLFVGSSFWTMALIVFIISPSLALTVKLAKRARAWFVISAVGSQRPCIFVWLPSGVERETIKSSQHVVLCESSLTCSLSLLSRHFYTCFALRNVCWPTCGCLLCWYSEQHRVCHSKADYRERQRKQVRRIIQIPSPACNEFFLYSSIVTVWYKHVIFPYFDVILNNTITKHTASVTFCFSVESESYIRDIWKCSNIVRIAISLDFVDRVGEF